MRLLPVGESRSRRLAALILALLVAASYGESLLGDFVWDDRPLILENERVRSAARLDDLLTSSFWETGDRHDRFRAFYRPLVGLTYFTDHVLWELRPWGYHLTNLLLHLACCWLVLTVARQEGLREGPALAGAALFAVHPVHVESVAWIAGRTDVLCTAGVLAAFLLHRRVAASGRPARIRAASLACFGLALLAKEMAATFPLLVALDRWAERRRKGEALRAAAPYVLVLAGSLALRHALIGGMGEPLVRLDPGAWAATAVFVVARYATLLLLPLGLDAHYPHGPVEPAFTPLLLVAGAMLAVIAGCCVRLLRRVPGAGFWMAWTLVTLAPVLAFGRFGDVVLADRFLYLPSVGACLLAARGLALLSRAPSGPDAGLAMDRPSRIARGLVAACTACAVGMLAFAARERAKVWRDDRALFSSMVATSPDSALVHCNLGLALYRGGDVEAAVAAFREALRLEPTYSMAFNNLGVALEGLNRRAGALRSYRSALDLAPDQLEAGVNAGQLLTRTGRVAEGLDLLRDVRLRHPDSGAALYALAEALERAGRRAEALPLLQRARLVDPGNAGVHYLLGRIRFDEGSLAPAAEEMRSFLELWPHEEDAFARAARDVIRRARASREARPAVSTGRR
jgi:Flp pilus assembly protein TadD